MSKKSDMFPEAQFADGVVFDFFKPRSPAVSEFYDWGPSRTRQEFAEDCDINNIMAKYEHTGVLPQSGLGEPHYADYTNVPDLMGAMEIMNIAQAEFMTLPARVRREFDNDPMQFVGFASDPGNLDQMRAWGLAPPKPAEPPPAAPPILPTVSPVAAAPAPVEPPKPA